MVKLTVAAVILVVAAAMSLTEAQDVASCASKLTLCAEYISSNTTPSANCCNAIRDAVTNDLPCLCKLYKDPDLFKTLNISVAAALQLTQKCNESTDLSACNKAASPTGSVPPPPGQAEAADRILWTGVTSLLLFLTFAVLY